MAKMITLKDFLNDTVPVIHRALKSSVQLNMELGDDAINVKIDVIQMRMAILAIVNNADEAVASKGQLYLRVCRIKSDDLPEAVKEELRQGEYACICIRDTGKGMDENTLRRIFEPFFSTKFEGRGLSMAAVFGIIKNHDGWILVRSKPGEGTEVQIYLPVVP